MVAAAMDYLAARVDVDAERIGLYGGSQAGWVVPKVAARRTVAFMVLQSCPVDDGMSQELYLVENVLDLLGLPEGERAQILDLGQSYDALIRASKTYEEFSRDREALLAEAKQHPWYAKLERPPTAAKAWFLAPEAGVVSGPVFFRPLDPKMFEFGRRALVDDAPPRLDDLRSPLLVLYGTRDVAVDWRLGSSTYQRLSETTSNPDVTVVLFEGADHTLLQPDRDGYLDFAPGLLTTVGEWPSKHR
jgi:pimeloyl-ACP methyl ester carboxylesterase